MILFVVTPTPAIPFAKRLIVTVPKFVEVTNARPMLPLLASMLETFVPLGIVRVKPIYPVPIYPVPTIGGGVLLTIVFVVDSPSIFPEVNKSILKSFRFKLLVPDSNLRLEAMFKLEFNVITPVPFNLKLSNICALLSI